MSWLRRLPWSCANELKPVLPSSSFSTSQVRTNAWRASLGKISRTQYLLKYPVRLMRPDGSTIEARAAEPREIVQLAVDLKALSEDERRQRLAARKPKAKKIEKEVIDDTFVADDYMKMFYSASSTSPAPPASQTNPQKKAKSKR